MKNLLLATDTYSIIWIAVLVVALGAFLLYTYFRSKKDQEKAKEMLDSLKKGEKVITQSGIIGTVVSFEEKEGFKTITLCTGDAKNKSYLTFDIGAVAMVLKKKDNVEVSVENVESPEVEVKEEAEVPKQENQEKPKQAQKKKSK